MKYTYDGSLEGLFTIIFEQYKFLEQANISIKNNQLDFLNDDIFVQTDTEKFTRVKKSLIKNFGYAFYTRINLVYLSEDHEKSAIIAKTVKNMYKYGYNYLNSSDIIAAKFNRLCKFSSREIHSYKGLLRFKEIQEGFLFAEFEPKNDILQAISYHFIRRLTNEKFVIYDKTRSKCSIYSDHKLNFYDVQKMFTKESLSEKFFEDCWIEFYNSVGISERKNPKLMQNNMPKRYWKYLPEKQNIKDVFRK